MNIILKTKYVVGHNHIHCIVVKRLRVYVDKLTIRHSTTFALYVTKGRLTCCCPHSLAYAKPFNNAHPFYPFLFFCYWARIYTSTLFAALFNYSQHLSIYFALSLLLWRGQHLPFHFIILSKPKTNCVAFSEAMNELQEMTDEWPSTFVHPSFFPCYRKLTVSYAV